MFLKDADFFIMYISRLRDKKSMRLVLLKHFFFNFKKVYKKAKKR